MSKTMLHATIVGVFAFGLLSLPSSARQREIVSHAQAATPVAMTADNWQTKENAEFRRQLGFFHGLMRLNSGNAVLKGFSSATEQLSSTLIRSDEAHPR